MWDRYYPKFGLWKTVEEALRTHTIAELNLLAKALPDGKLEGLKADRIAAICRRLKGKSLRDFWSRLTELQQAAVAQAVHSPDARFSPEGFKIRYGEDADYGKESISGLEKPTSLCLFIHGVHVSLDLRERLRAMRRLLHGSPPTRGPGNIACRRGSGISSSRPAPRPLSGGHCGKLATGC